MSKDKYPCIFSCQMEAIVFIFLQIFFTTRVVLKIGEYLVNKPLQAAGASKIVVFCTMIKLSLLFMEVDKGYKLSLRLRKRTNTGSRR